MSGAAFVFYRLVAEMAAIVGVLVAGGLAYADKSPWVWSWFLVFAFCNIVTGGSVKSESKVETSETKSADAVGDRVPRPTSAEVA